MFLLQTHSDRTITDSRRPVFVFDHISKGIVCTLHDLFGNLSHHSDPIGKIGISALRRHTRLGICYKLFKLFGFRIIRNAVEPFKRHLAASLHFFNLDAVNGHVIGFRRILFQNISEIKHRFGIGIIFIRRIVADIICIFGAQLIRRKPLHHRIVRGRIFKSERNGFSAIGLGVYGNFIGFSFKQVDGRHVLHRIPRIPQARDVELRLFHPVFRHFFHRRLSARNIELPAVEPVVALHGKITVGKIVLLFYRNFPGFKILYSVIDGHVINGINARNMIIEIVIIIIYIQFGQFGFVFVKSEYRDRR